MAGYPLLAAILATFGLVFVVLLWAHQRVDDWPLDPGSETGSGE